MAVIGATGSLGGFAGGNALARLLVVFSGDTSSLDAAIARSQGTLSGFGANAANIGRALSRTVTLPVLAVGGAALFMAAQFESAIGRIAGLTPIVEQSGYSIGEIRQRLLDLAQVVPTAPNELAESLYFAGSAGLDAATAFQVVELSAKGAAIGMGEAGDISRVLIGALNNWGESGLTAAEAMDALTAAVREGTAEPAEMAIALGRLMPVARQAGVTFEETVGSLAALTNLGFPARVATTSIRALFAELLAPTQQATERLHTLGLTADDVRDSLRFGGPIAAFELLEDAVHGDQDALRDILPQIRGFSAYVGLAGEHLDNSAHIMEATTNSLGDLDRAFAIIEQTPQFKFGIALNKMRVAAIDLGAVLFPVFDKIIQVVSDVGDRIAGLEKPLQIAAAGFAIAAAAAGPLLQLLSNMGAFTGSFALGFKSMTVNIITLGIAVVALVGAFRSLREGSTSLFSIFTTMASATLAAYAALKLFYAAVNAGALGVNRFSLALVGISPGMLGGIAVALGLIVTAFGLIAGASQKVNQSVKQMGEAMLSAAESGATLRAALRSIEDEELRGRLQAIAKELGILDNIASESFDELGRGIGHDLIDSLSQLREDLSLSGEAIAQLGEDGIASLSDFEDAFVKAVATGQDLAPVLREAGIEAGAFEDIMGAAAKVSPDFASQVANISELAKSYAKTILTLDNYEQKQLGIIAITEAEKEAVADWAHGLGLGAEGVDYLAGRLQDYGITAVGANAQVRDSFERAAFGVDENGNKISARVAMMEAQIAESAAGISESIAGSFSAFEKAEGQVKKSTDALTDTFVSNARTIVDEVSNVLELAGRGVPADLLQVLVDQGPGMVAKFVDASDAELRRLTVAYQTQLAATDSAILEEALHQKTKGRNMVAKFTEGILSNSSLPPTAAAKIVNDMTAAFARGDISEAGLDLARRFANALGTVKGLTSQVAVQAMNWFAQQIDKQDLSRVGRRQAQELARGLAQETGLTRAAARDLVGRIVTAAKDKGVIEAPKAGTDLANQYRAGILSRQGRVENAGQSTGSKAVAGMRLAVGPAFTAGSRSGASYAGGISSQEDAAYNAGFAVGQAANQGFDDGSKGSPRYFTYYLGRELVESLADGIKDGRSLMGSRPAFSFPVSLETQGRLRGGMGTNGDRPMGMDVDVTIDRRNVAREVDWNWRVGGG